MAEKLMVYEPGDRFATISRTGEARIWQIDNDGIPKLTQGRPSKVQDKK